MPTDGEAGGQSRQGGHSAGTAVAPRPVRRLYRARAEARRTAQGTGPRSPIHSETVR